MNQSENEAITKAVEALKEARRYIDRLTSDYSSHAVDDLKDVDEALAALTALQEQPAPVRESLTEYEIQVLLGTSISGCNMEPSRVFSLHMAWHRLYAIGLIDRTDGLAIITDKGREVVNRILSALAPSPARDYRKMVQPAREEAEQKFVCINAHDYCYGGAGGPCDYCERVPSAREEGDAMVKG